MTSATAKPRCLKLQDPLELTNKKNNVSVEHWLTKIEGKMMADKNLMDTLTKRMVHVMNRVSGKAFSHLEPRTQKNTTNPWKDLDKIFAYLKRVFSDPNRHQNAETEFQALRQGNKDFNTF